MVMAYGLFDQNTQIPYEGRNAMTKTEFKRNLPEVKALFSEEKDVLKNILWEVMPEVSAILPQVRGAVSSTPCSPASRMLSPLL